MVAVLLCACGANSTLESGAANQPNILLIVADDLGFSDLGVYGSEIETPRIDELAHHGQAFTNFYAAPTCSPARAMLLTGVDSHLTGLGTMAERRTAAHEGIPGYEGHLNDEVLTVAERLREIGYRTYMTGKWHLGLSFETNPVRRGFERSFALLSGGAFHLSDLPTAHPGLTGVKKARYTENGEPAELPSDFYSTRFFADRLIEYIEEGRDLGRPFFAYLAFTAPHFPLQAPNASIAKQAGRYDAGYNQIHKRRLARMRAMGVLDGLDEVPEADWYAPWHSLAEGEKRVESRRMEVYAAMIADLDAYVGKVVDYLKNIGAFENTYIIFLSDNGPEGRNVAQSIRAIEDWPDLCCDRRPENIGAADSYEWTGSGWARVSATPFRGRKGSALDGGLRVPAIISHIETQFAAPYSDELVTIRDILPTILDIASSDAAQTNMGRSDVHEPSGASLLPYLRGDSRSVHGGDYAAGWELSGRRAVRQGEWKLLRESTPGGLQDWALYNTPEDLGERHDLSGRHPEKFAQLLAIWETYRAENGVYVAQP